MRYIRDAWRPGVWPSSIDYKHCCIYRVPNNLRRVNPEAYTPHMLIIGPLHHDKKFASNDSRFVNYTNMELCKVRYLKAIEDMYGVDTILYFKKIIERNEQIIRASYAESTEWIKSEDFVDMILYDSVFILKFMMEFQDSTSKRKGDFLFDQPGLVISIILEDLMLLENQLPFALLKELFEPLYKEFHFKVLEYFGFQGHITTQVNFSHFTDLFRQVSLSTLDPTQKEDVAVFPFPRDVENLHNADWLSCAGVDFEVDLDSVHSDNALTLGINFNGGILRMACFKANEHTEKILRNIMALEQCHYSLSPVVCHYVAFLDRLIDTDQDVDLLVNKGVVKNFKIQGPVTKMVDKLCEGVNYNGLISNYEPVAAQLNKHCKRRINTLRVNMSVATLRRVYFKDLWTGTATLSAVVLLVLTLIGTIASVLQVMQGPKS